MIRASDHGGESDRLSRALTRSGFTDRASDVARMMRQMMCTYHQADREHGDTEAEKLSERVPELMPVATRVNSVGLWGVYRTTVAGRTYRCTWRELMAKGSYNHVYFADLTAVPPHGRLTEAETTPAVVKITTSTDKDLRVFLLENAIHALLGELEVSCDFVVRLHYPFRVRRGSFPYFDLGTVMDNPGHGHLGDWIYDHLRTDRQMFTIMAQLAWTLLRLQRALEFAHRDFKCDNIMLAADPSDRVHATLDNGSSLYFPTNGLRCLLIDFGMARLTLGGEYIACDCIHIDRRGNVDSFNPCQDLQNLCCTMLEDYADVLQERAPRFCQWLRSQCSGINERLLTLWPNYYEASRSTRHERLSYIVTKERMVNMHPYNMLLALQPRVALPGMENVGNDS
jgi:serine/threonine protein kinase